MPLGRLNAPSTARSTAAEKYGAGRRAVAWRAGYQTRIGNVRGFPVAGSIRAGSARNPDRTPIGHGPVGAGSASRAAATGARSSGANAEPAGGGSGGGGGGGGRGPGGGGGGAGTGTGGEPARRDQYGDKPPRLVAWPH